VGRKKPLPDGGTAGPFNAAFAELEALKSTLGATSASADPGRDDPAPAEPETAPTEGGSDPRVAAAHGKIVVRRERKGHGGKTVTRITGFRTGPEAMESLARELAKRLGVGAKVEGEHLWVQGDQVERLQDILPQMGAKKVVAGN